MSKVVDDRLARANLYGEMINMDEATVEDVANVTSAIVESTDGMVNLDSIVSGAGDKDNKINLSSIVAQAVFAGTEGQVTTDSLDVAFGLVSSISKRYEHINMDDVGNISGGDIIATYVALNIFTVLSANLPFVGDIADLVAMQGGKDNTKFQVVSANAVVVDGMGETVKGDVINSVNAGKSMAYSERKDTQEFVTATLTYTFNAKKLVADTGNYAMERGTNEVIIGGSIFINDFEVASTEAVATRTVTVDSIDYKATFNYEAGTIVLVLSDNIVADTKIYFIASLSADKLGEITGSVGTEISTHTYVAKPVALNTKVNTLKLRQVLQATGLNLNSNDLVVALNKIAEETKAMKLEYATMFAKPFGTTIDITSATETTIADRYKHFLIGVEEAKANIVTTSQLTSTVCLVGGSGLVKLFAGLSNDATTTRIITDDNNSIRRLGVLNNSYECFFDPNHDTKYPIVGQVSKIFVVGNPSEPSKKVAIAGVGLPILPEDLGLDTNSNKTISLQGKMVISFNKESRSQELVKTLSVKL